MKSRWPRRLGIASRVFRKEVGDHLFSSLPSACGWRYITCFSLKSLAVNDWHLAAVFVSSPWIGRIGENDIVLRCPVPSVDVDDVALAKSSLVVEYDLFLGLDYYDS